MNITVNGEIRTLAPGTTVQALVDSLSLHTETVVVQRNNEIVERKQFAETPLAAGDVVEVVRLVGGG